MNEGWSDDTEKGKQECCEKTTVLFRFAHCIRHEVTWGRVAACVVPWHLAGPVLVTFLNVNVVCRCISVGSSRFSLVTLKEDHGSFLHTAHNLPNYKLIRRRYMKVDGRKEPQILTEAQLQRVRFSQPSF